MKLSGIPSNSTLQNVAFTESVKDKKHSTSGRLASVVDRCANTPAKFPLPETGRSHRTKKNELKMVKYFDSNAISRQRLAATSLDEAKVELRIKREVLNLDLVEKSRKDPEFARQVIDSVYASIYSRAKDSFGHVCVKDGKKVLGGYLFAIGEEARRINLSGSMKDGIFTPDAAGANPFVTPVASVIQKSYMEYFCQPGNAQKLRAQVEPEIEKAIAPLVKQYGLPSPYDFAKKLAAIGESWKMISGESLI
ncbi:hypothetical protein JFK97_11560 [Chromobacterium phragmitis]|uniref:hypothetical protein n=2 Tax=Chromobacterium amazonense TaxID=1382803 RepID=UPI0021B74000|nr:hypothetical protein [Chromobacterium amazonense]MBM2885027.1 hypothetical protein [Chromobacterium amazonense]